MLNSISRWLAAHPRWTVTLLVTVLLGPFLAKPFNIDDPLFIWLAEHIRANAADPFGFSVNWYGTVQPMWTVTENPPLAGYFFALAGSLFGWSEMGFHLAGLLVAVAVILGTYRLAGRLCSQPLFAACATLLTPLFLVSANTVMCDLLMLAFWVWSLVFWLEGIEDDRAGKIIAAGFLAALSLLTKYFGVALVPLLIAHGLAQKRQAGTWMAGVLIPLIALGAYQWFTLVTYGHALLLAAAGYASSVQGELGFSKLSSGLIALAFIGGGAATALFLAPSVWRARTLAVIGSCAAILVAAGCAAGLVLQKYSALATPGAKLALCAQFLPWAVGGVLVLALAAADVWRQPRDARAWLLACWVGGTFFFAGFANWTVNGRSLLPLVPAVGILLARRREMENFKRPWTLRAGWALSAALALVVTQSDFQLAAAGRRSAEAALAQCGGTRGTIWFEGHWGFQYYMENLGAKAVDFKNDRQLLPGDMLVIPQHNTDVKAPPAAIIAHEDIVQVPVGSAVTTWENANGAGFYSSVVGPLPFAFGNPPPEIVYVFRLKAPGTGAQGAP